MPPKGSRYTTLKRNLTTRRLASRRGTTSAYAVRRSGRNYSGAGTLSKVFPNYKRDAPFAPRKTVRLVYKAVDLLTAGATNMMGAIKEFCLNSLFDPDKSGAGHQPYGFDSMALLYATYKINKVKVKFEFVDPSINSLAFGIMITNPTSTAVSIAGMSSEILGEKSMGTVKYLSFGGGKKQTMSFTLPLNEIFQITKAQYANDIENTTSTVAGSPASAVDIQIACANIRGDGTGTMVCMTTLTYYATFYDRIMLAQS